MEDRWRSVIEVNADGVNAILHYFRKRILELSLIHVVLILADADGFWLNLDQLVEWVLKTSSQGDRASFLDAKFWEFGFAKFGGAINRGAAFVDDENLNRKMVILNDLR